MGDDAMIRAAAGLFIGTAIALVSSVAFAAQPADILFHNGKVITADASATIRSAVAVKDGKILAVGGPELASEYNATKTVDLAGKVLMPGFNDSHLHTRSLARREIEPAKAKSIADIQDMIRKKAAEIGPGEWITGYGWDEALLAEKRNPNRADLDAAAPRNPVALTRAGGHSVVGNSLAIQRAKITRSTPEPKGGLIEKGADGEPNGMIRERNDLFLSLVPKDRWEDLKAGYMKEMRRYLTLGITSFHSASGSLNDEPVGKGGVAEKDSGLTFRRFQEMARDSGYTLPRVTMYTSYPGAKRLQEYGHATGYGDAWVRLGGIGENPVDGGFTGPTAWTLADYKGLPGFRGKGRFTDAELQDLVDSASKSGWQMALHAIGDAAIKQTVDAYAASLTKMPRQDHRWFLDHFTIMPPDETMAKMKKFDMAIAQQPNFLYNLEGRYHETMDQWREDHNNSVGTPAHKFGIPVAFGSDNLPIDPRVGLYAAVTRKGPSGTAHGYAEEAVTIDEAIRRYTYMGAWLSFEEKAKGTIEPGRFADLIVLDSDPLLIAPEKLLTMQVDQTYLDGKLVYDRLAR
jgi:predicted amidohydrolase YtcJ